MRKNIFFVFYLLIVMLIFNGCLSYDKMQLKLANEQNGTLDNAVGTFSYPNYNYSFQLTRGDGDTDNGLFEIRGRNALYLKNGVTPTTKEYSVRVAFGAGERSSGMQKIFTFVLPTKEAPEVILAQQQLQEQPRPSAPLPPPAVSAQFAWTVNNTSSWIEAVNGIRNGGDNSIHLVSVSGTVSIPSNTENTFGSVTGITVNIEGSGSLSPSANGSLLYIGRGQTIIIKDLTLRGRDANSASVVYIGTGGSLSLKGNAKITGNTTTRISSGSNAAIRSAGVYVGTNATFTMYDNAAVSGNISASSVGGVIVNGGTFTMEGGTISGNSSLSTSLSTTSFTGGGVFINNGTFSMLGGTISGNTSTGGGGGVYIGGGNFNMLGGTISDNITENNDRFLGQVVYGGGVYIAGGTFTMQDGTISGNTATANGGGVYVRNVFIMQGGTIRGNTAPIGGGVCIGSDVYGGAFTMQGGTISGNTASMAGGGVSVSGRSGIFSMQGGSVSGNSANGNGGGVLIVSDILGTFIMQGNALVAGNTSGDKGGGVYIGSRSTFNKTGGNIYGNDATQNIRNTAASMKGHAIFENTEGRWRNASAGPTMSPDSYGFWLNEE